MIDVTKDIMGEQCVIDMNDGEFRHLVDVLKDYLDDKDRNERDGSYEIIQDLYNKIINS